MSLRNAAAVANEKVTDIDSVSTLFYELKFERAYLARTGAAFQDLIHDLLTAAYPSDFVQVRSYGRAGDEKNDGLIRSERILLQIYAPRLMTDANAIPKITADFEGAVLHWPNDFDTWIFVHNSRDGLSPGVVHELLRLDAVHPGKRTNHWGLPQLLRIMRHHLDAASLNPLFGPAPTLADLADLGYADIQPLLQAFDCAPTPPTADGNLSPVSEQKMNRNGLSPSAQALLTMGLARAPMIQSILESWPNPSLGDRVADAFHREYVNLRRTGLPPDRILEELEVFSLGPLRHTPKLEIACLTLLAYLFERCDIFESVAQVVTS